MPVGASLYYAAKIPLQRQNYVSDLAPIWTLKLEFSTGTPLDLTGSVQGATGKNTFPASLEDGSFPSMKYVTSNPKKLLEASLSTQRDDTALHPVLRADYQLLRR